MPKPPSSAGRPRPPSWRKLLSFAHAFLSTRRRDVISSLLAASKPCLTTVSSCFWGAFICYVTWLCRWAFRFRFLFHPSFPLLSSSSRGTRERWWKAQKSRRQPRGKNSKEKQSRSDRRCFYLRLVSGRFYDRATRLYYRASSPRCFLTRWRCWK